MEENFSVNSIYVHIPFCSNICTYCDFCKFYYNEKLVNNYLNALDKEITTNYKNELISTLYIGGGTPSSLKLEELHLLFSIIKKIRLADNYEFTIECNIEDITEEKLSFFMENGVNRISIGIQSFNDKILSFLGRNYNKNIIFDNILLVKKYFTNINVDLIYAIPFQTIDMLKEDLDLFLKLGVTHISTYSLIIENNTKLFINKVDYIDEEIDKEMYDLICDKLNSNGFIHYEVSNFCKEGYHSKHNLVYWMNKKYYGFGLGASGYINIIRYTNTRNFNKYLNGNYERDTEIITSSLNASNYAILGFRTLYGVSKKEFESKFGKSLIDYFNVKDLLDNNIILENQDRYYINPKYFYILNEVLVKFI